MEKKLFCFDFDGTLLDDNEKIHQNNLEMLSRVTKLGHETAICTGKSIQQLNDYLPQLSFMKVIATLNGSILNFIKEGKTINLASPIDYNVINFLVQIARINKRELHWHTINQNYYAVAFYDEHDKKNINKSFFDSIEKSSKLDDWDEVKETLQKEKIIQISLKVQESEVKDLYEVIKEFVKDRYNVVITSRTYIVINDKGIDKKLAIEKIQSLLNIKKQDIFVFGDSDNDISMFKYACGIAMGNATNSLKYYARKIIGSNNTDAIANFISSIIEKKQSLKQLEPSLLAFNVNTIPEQLKAVKDVGIETIHYDVMDGFVNNKSFDNEWMQTIVDLGLNVNVHLMVYKPIEWIDRFASYYPFSITFQFEATNFKEAIECIKRIKSFNIKSGIAIKPYTIFEDYLPLLKHIDIVTIMTVEPGKGGQKFNIDAIQNLINVYTYKQKVNKNLIIEIDGGIKIDNVKIIKKYCDYIVSGTGFMNLEKQKQLDFINLIKEIDFEE